MNKKDSLLNYLKWSADEVKAVEEFQAKLDEKLLEVMRTGNFSYQDMYRLLEPFISDYTFLYKIRVGENALYRADNRHVSWRLMVAMRRIFGISIDAIIDKLFQGFPLRTPPKK